VTAEKVEIVENNAETYGLNVTLDAIGLPKSTWYYWKDHKVDYEEKYAYLREPLIEVLKENPAYGYRRIEPELKELGYSVGETGIRRVLGMWDLSLQRWAGKPKPSVPRKPGPLQVFYTDFTAIWYADGRKKAYLMPLVDDATKWVIGWAVGYRPNTELALECLSMAQATLADVGLSLEGRIIHHDQDAVYTGYRWLRAVLINHRARISFSENGAKGNTTMESFNGRFKVENESLFHEAANIWELERVIAAQIEYHNCRRRHSTLGYQAPIDYIIQEAILSQPAVGLAIQCT
jgi:putative transposase